jgi:hypothetical protein
LSSKKAARSRLLDLQVGPRLLERLFKRRRRLYGLLSLSTAPGGPTYPPRITEHGAGNQRNYSGDQAK